MGMNFGLDFGSEFGEWRGCKFVARGRIDCG